jgi:hypothetical protein
MWSDRAIVTRVKAYEWVIATIYGIFLDKKAFHHVPIIPKPSCYKAFQIHLATSLTNTQAGTLACHLWATYSISNTPTRTCYWSSCSLSLAFSPDIGLHQHIPQIGHR